jgi:hypothetical protein
MSAKNSELGVFLALGTPKTKIKEWLKFSSGAPCS